MKSIKTIGMLVVGFIAGALSANATVLTFEGLTGQAAEDITAFNQGYGGLTWTTGNNWSLFQNPAYPTPTFGSYGLVNNIGANPAMVTGTNFTFNQVEVVGWYFNSPAQIGVRAFDAGNALIGDTGLVGINQSSYTTLSGGWSGIARLEFYGGSYFAIDNLVINEGRNNVPEGGMTVCMLGLALTGIAGYRRKLLR